MLILTNTTGMSRLKVFYKLYSRQRRVKYSSRCSSKYHLRTQETVVGPKRFLAAHLSLLWLPWIVALLFWPFVYDLQGIPLPKRLPWNPRPRPPVSYAADHEELNVKPWKSIIIASIPTPLVKSVRYVLAGTMWWLDFHKSIPGYRIHGCPMKIKCDLFRLLTLRWLMSYIYRAHILDVSRSHTTTQHSR